MASETSSSGGGIELAVEEICFRKPEAEDGRVVWELVRNTGVLELNSPYAYVLFCEYFSTSCMLAELRGEVVGVVIGFLPPERTDTLFVWQVGVDSAVRGRAIGTRLLHALMSELSATGVCFLEATVTPSNRASHALFRRFAESAGAAWELKPCFGGELFPGEDHEEEDLYRIGPIEEGYSGDI